MLNFAFVKVPKEKGVKRLGAEHQESSYAAQVVGHETSMTGPQDPHSGAELTPR